MEHLTSPYRSYSTVELGMIEVFVFGLGEGKCFKSLSKVLRRRGATALQRNTWRNARHGFAVLTKVDMGSYANSNTRTGA